LVTKSRERSRDPVTKAGGPAEKRAVSQRSNSSMLTRRAAADRSKLDP
jgi:hypothetical protein